jgi:hypothetical protein
MALEILLELGLMTRQTAATMTMNSPESLLQLHKLVSQEKSVDESVYLAELVREIGLKCIGFNGVCSFPQFYCNPTY